MLHLYDFPMSPSLQRSTVEMERERREGRERGESREGRGESGGWRVEREGGRVERGGGRGKNNETSKREEGRERVKSVTLLVETVLCTWFWHSYGSLPPRESQENFY